MTNDRGMRASDRDREQAAEVLRDAYAAGRLELDEFQERAGAAYSATTWGALRDLTADLPAGQAPFPGGIQVSSGSGVARVPRRPMKRPFAPLWAMVVIWLAIAAAAHAAAAIPLVMLSMFVLRAACWSAPADCPPSRPDGAEAPGSTSHLTGDAAPADLGRSQAVHDGHIDATRCQHPRHRARRPAGSGTRRHLRSAGRCPAARR